MSPERWQEIIGNIKDNFSVIDKGSEHLTEGGGVDIEYIIFQGPLGKMRLEFISKPIIIDKKTTYSRRIGSETKVDYVYSQEEKSHLLKAYKWDEDQEEWIEIEAGDLDTGRVV